MGEIGEQQSTTVRAIRKYRHRGTVAGLLALVLITGATSPVAASPVAPPRPRADHLATEVTADIIVYGGTPGGVVAAVSAARAGARVILVEPTDRIGGMMSGGLSWTDRGDIGVIGGTAREVFDRIQTIEQSAYGRYAFQPSSARAAFTSMLAEAGVQVVIGERLAESSDAVTKLAGRITRIRMASGHTFVGSVFVDAGYEGDLMARAGIAYRVGREATTDYGEGLAGVRPATVAFQPGAGIAPGFPLAAPGPIGSGDTRTQAYNYRVCLSTDPANQVPFPMPDGYDPARYDIVAAYLAELVSRGEVPTKSWVLHVDRLTNSKWDLNENGPITLGLPGANYAYPDATYGERASIDATHRDYQQGFLYFLRNDLRVPVEIRTDMARFGLCADEFVENGNWPPLLYLREGRRMIGRFVVSQHDARALISKPDTIGLASYPLDSHNVSRWIDGSGRLLTEGGLGLPMVQRWSIPYGAITPRRAQAANLLVPVAASATHVAYASLRMEPQFMIMGQAAGTAAAIAWSRGLAVQDVAVAELRSRLAASGAVLTDPGDIATSFYTEISWAYYEGITTGCGGVGRFCPGQSLPRDQMASLLTRALVLPPATRDYFTDDQGNMHEASINAVARAGITVGCGGGRYCPSATVTRQEMASFLVRAFVLPRSTTDHFSDDTASAHHDDINALASAGITSGCSPIAYCPTSPVTRGQVIAFLFRLYGGGPSGGTGVASGSADTYTTRTPGSSARDDADAPTSSPQPSPTPAATPGPTPGVTNEPSPTPTALPSPTPTPASPSPAPSSP